MEAAIMHPIAIELRMKTLRKHLWKLTTVGYTPSDRELSVRRAIQVARITECELEASPPMPELSSRDQMEIRLQLCRFICAVHEEAFDDAHTAVDTILSLV